MLRIAKKFVERVRAATRPEDLYEMVQSAIELEHATIPPYLCAYFTLKLGTNQTVANLIRSVVVEEMLHLSIASNLMIAIGGKPVLNKPGFIPVYPGPLPMDIAGGLIVPLEKCSIELIRDVFMKIEEPEDPLQPTRKVVPEETEYETIGQFYAALDAKIEELGQSAFIGDFEHEMVNNSWFPPDQLFRITGPATASRAIDIIVQQGEGTTTSLLDPEGVPAHYYRFQEIVEGKRIVIHPNGSFSFSGAPIIFDHRAVWNMQPNPNPDDLPPESLARSLSLQFAYSYTALLNSLHETFNGDPAAIDRAMGQMYDMRLLAQRVLATPVPDAAGNPTDQSTGLSFRYQPVIG